MAITRSKSRALRANAQQQAADTQPAETSSAVVLYTNTSLPPLALDNTAALHPPSSPSTSPSPVPSSPMSTSGFSTFTSISSSSSVFPPASTDQPSYFDELPEELRHRIWSLCLPGKIIELFNTPDAIVAKNIESFKWKAIQCSCERRCECLPALARTNKEVFNIATRHRSSCFETSVDWLRDTIYIGESVGHLHNTGFLKALEQAGCRDNLRHLAVHEDVWRQTREFHGEDPAGHHIQCGPAATILRLPNLKDLTLVARAGGWINDHYDVDFENTDDRDSEFDFDFDEVDCCSKEHRHFTDITVSQDCFADDLGITCTPSGGIIKDEWACKKHESDPLIDGHGSYHPVHCDEDNDYGCGLHKTLPVDSCGLALVNYFDIDGCWWKHCHEPEENRLLWLKEQLGGDFEALKGEGTVKLFAGDKGIAPRWAIPKLEFAIVRNTAPSCFVDYAGNEKDWTSSGHICSFGEELDVEEREKFIMNG